MARKIAYVLFDYTNSGGIERVLSNKTNYLVNLGYDISIITFRHPKDREPFFTFDNRIRFYDLDLPLDEYDIRSKKLRQIFVDKLSILLNQIQPDITVAIGMELGFYTCLARDKSKKVLESHFSKYKRKLKLVKLDSYYLTRFIPFLYTYNQTKLIKRFDKYVVLTEEDKESWRGVDNIEVIPNALTFIPDDKSLVESKNVISVGRYTTQKGFDRLIDIWRIVSPKFPDWHLNIYGSGTDRKRKKLEVLIEKYKLTDTVALKPPTSNIKREFLNSSVYAMTSRYEGLPMVLIEAMACGLPPVSYACKCGPRDVINEGEDGFLVEMGDKEKFAERLSLLMANEDTRKKMGKAASVNILRLSEDNIMKKWITLFDELTEN